MEVQSIVDVITGIVGAVIGWFVKIMWDSVKELQKDMKETNQALHENYVRKDDYRIDMAEIKGMFNRIMDKLDSKADKAS
jgi:uncharacterized membrane protein (DUF106 family)